MPSCIIILDKSLDFYDLYSHSFQIGKIFHLRIGWLDYWGHPHNMVDTNASAKALDAILATGANINIYMVHGGTSFGFDNGANLIPTLAVKPKFCIKILDA